MKIVHAHWSLNTGGTETMMVDIMNEQSHTNEVWCLILNDEVDEKVKARISPRIQFKCYHRKDKIKGLFDILCFNLDLLRISPDVIHTHGESFPSIIKIPMIPIVLTRHSTLGNGKYCSFADKLCFISNAVRQHSILQGYDGQVVYNGIHADQIIRKKNFNRNSRFRIIQVGRLEKIKGQHLLLEAAYILRQKGIVDFSIDFIGDGTQYDFLQSIIKKYALENCVSLLGVKDRDYIYSHLCEYDLYVQPSLSEGFGLTIAEAIAASLPVLVSNLPGPMEVIDNGRLGAYFEAGNIESLAKELLNIIQGNVEDKRLSAISYLESNFTIQSTARNYIDVYDRLINGNN